MPKFNPFGNKNQLLRELLEKLDRDRGGLGLKNKIKNLDHVADDSECNEIIAEDMVDFLSSDDLEKTIQHWVSKLRHSGKIVIGGTDMYEVCKHFFQKGISTKDANILIHGEQKEAWDFRINQTTIENLESILSNLGIDILKKRSSNFKMVIEGERP